MSRLGSGIIRVAPTNNIYTALAFISMMSTLVALIWAYWRLRELGATPF